MESCCLLRSSITGFSSLLRHVHLWFHDALLRACFINRSDSPPGLKPGRLRASNAGLKACSSTQEFGTVFMKHALGLPLLPQPHCIAGLFFFPYSKW